jgi:hypothetical protein
VRAGSRALLATLALAPAVPAAAWTRTATPDGLCQWWGTRQIHYRVTDPSAVAGGPCHDGGDPLEAVALSYQAWSGGAPAGEALACTDLRLVPDGVVPTAHGGDDGQNAVIFRRGSCEPGAGLVPAGHPCLAEGTCAEAFQCWDHDARYLALTTTTYRVETGEIVDADIEVNGTSEGALGGFPFTCVDPPAPTCRRVDQAGCIFMDLRNTLTHEVGHVLGFAHDPGVESSMNGQASAGETSKRTLHADDVAGLCAVYPRGAPTSTCGESGGCATPRDGPGGGLAMLAAGTALWRLRPGRRRRQDTTTPA